MGIEKIAFQRGFAGDYRPTSHNDAKDKEQRGVYRVYNQSGKSIREKRLYAERVMINFLAYNIVK